MKVATGQKAFEMDSAENGLRVEVQMPDTGIARVHQGDEVEVGFPSVGGAATGTDRQRYAAVVTEVGTRASTGNAFTVRADLRGAPEGLRPGMTAEVFFSFALVTESIVEVEGFLLPISSALVESGHLRIEGRRLVLLQPLQ